ncbi:RNA polymerase III subunit Rpc25-domain-containing protein [Naematelia encephala]|uniref:RNA polymerase III subunit Rpc25-domain-containing protein n=1 Tax=Naematelia encephala TaxID=71784 RepID=A0A1Y2ANC3_9TREE|nr:RNA polymerase III subunit Rpc25-domain-containing protein [Naematelia encephala]
MFVLIGVRDTVPVAPSAFEIPPHISITDALNKKYANKLVPEKGLALSVFDLLTVEDGKVTWGNGLMYYKVSFRLMLFAPFIGEVMHGRVLASTREYIRISTGFFQDIYITPALFPPNMAFDPSQNTWFWYSDSEDAILSQAELMNTIIESRLYIDVGEPIRFRVDSVEWQDVRPKPSPDLYAEGEATPEEKDPRERAGYKVWASIGEAGLGVITWWREGADEEIEEEAED